MKILPLFLFILAAVNLKAQEKTAIDYYQIAEKTAGYNRFKESNLYLDSCELLLGKATPKTLYLRISNLYKTTQEHPNNQDLYNNPYLVTKKILQYCDSFFSVVNMQNFPVDKYNFVYSVQTFYKEEIKKYPEYRWTVDKDKNPPEEAIKLLNSLIDTTRSKFSLGTYHNKDVFVYCFYENSQTNKKKSKWMRMQFYEIFIPSLCWLDVNVEGKEGMSIVTFKDKSNKAVGIFSYQDIQYNSEPLSTKDLQFDSNYPIVFPYDKKYYPLVDMTRGSDENNKEKIIKVFTFLIEYYGGGTKRPDER